ncbi:unnamed protein product [Diplocarpon coronariae]|uniref:Uncharacterized protein n=1 Tax=Diplocarpon coronariae TaxID=2795749 RepID=A0A218Z2C9_9HELO|nr:hypothetical protein B2J93_2416 [Marssonina coronariae]
MAGGSIVRRSKGGCAVPVCPRSPSTERQSRRAGRLDDGESSMAKAGEKGCVQWSTEHQASPVSETVSPAEYAGPGPVASWIWVGPMDAIMSATGTLLLELASRVLRATAVSPDAAGRRSRRLYLDRAVRDIVWTSRPVSSTLPSPRLEALRPDG